MSWKRVERGIRVWIGEGGLRTYHVDACRGYRRVQRKAGSSLDVARQVRSKLLLELAEQEEFPDREKVERISLANFIELYTDNYLKANAVKSWRKEVSRLRVIRSILGDPPLGSITTAHVERLLSQLQQKDYAPATLNRFRARLNSMMNKAEAWGYRSRGSNPVRGVSQFRERSMGDRYLTPIELEKLLGACGPELRALVIVAAYTGARQGELMSLRWSDIDLELGFMSIRAEVSKTSESRRVPLHAEARAVMTDLREKANGRERVFPFPAFPRKQWDDAISRLGWDRTEVPRLKGWRFHDMRHHCASQLVMADVPLTKVAKMLGHKRVATTQRYAHLCDSSLVAAIDRLPHVSMCNRRVKEGVESLTMSPEGA